MISLWSCRTTKTSVNKPLDNALLWKITGKDLKEPSYLFGTIHMIPSENFFYPKGTLSALESCQKIVFEIDMSELNGTEIFQYMNIIMMNDDLTLKDILNEDDYQTVANFFDEKGLPLMFFERMKPLFLTAFSQMDFDNQGLKGENIKSYEVELAEIASKSNIPTGGLESIEFQISIFDAIPYEDQAKMLVNAIKESQSGQDEFMFLVDTYVKQDINKMVSSIQDESGDYHKFEDLILIERNKKWIPLITALIQQKPTFIAVGAGHLAGQNGVIQLLRKEGFKVVPILK